ncbi:MAG: hypothetical protein AAB631_01895 [Patescibacteria group bacterium]
MLQRFYKSKNFESYLGAAALVYVIILVVCAAFLVQFVVREGLMAFRVPKAPAHQLPAFQIEKVQD